MKRRYLNLIVIVVLTMVSFTACSMKTEENGTENQMQNESVEIETTEVETTEAETEESELPVGTELETEESELPAETEFEELDNKVAAERDEGTETTKDNISNTTNNNTNNNYSAVVPSTSQDAALPVVKDVIQNIITDGMTELEKAKAIHDYMVMNIDYDVVNYDNNTVSQTSRTVEGTLTTKYAVCQGYALTYKALCEAAGLECEYVSGTARGGSHGWNQVKVDGVWYNVDVTWDDPSKRNGEVFDYHGYCRYDYFLISDGQIGRTHIAENAKYTCNSSLRETALNMHCPWRNYNYATSMEGLCALVDPYLASNSAVIYVDIDPNSLPTNSIYDLIAEAIGRCGYIDDYEIANIEYITDDWGIRKYTCIFTLNNGNFTKYTLATTEDSLKSEILKLNVGGSETQYIYVTDQLLQSTQYFTTIGKWLHFDAGLVMECYTYSPIYDGVWKAHISTLRAVTNEDVFIENAYSFAEVEAIVQDRLARGITNFTICYCTNTREEEEAAYSQVVNELQYQWEETYNLSVEYSAQSTTTFFIIFAPFQ